MGISSTISKYPTMIYEIYTVWQKIILFFFCCHCEETQTYLLQRRLPHLAFCSCKPTHYLQNFHFWLIQALISPNARHVQDIFLIIERYQMECIKYFLKYWFQNVLIVFSVIKLALTNTRTNNIHQTSINKTSLWNKQNP